MSKEELERSGMLGGVNLERLGRMSSETLRALKVLLVAAPWESPERSKELLKVVKSILRKRTIEAMREAV